VYSLVGDASYSTVSFWGGAASQWEVEFSDGLDEVLLLLVDIRPVFSTDNNCSVLSYLSISVKKYEGTGTTTGKISEKKYYILNHIV